MSADFKLKDEQREVVFHDDGDILVSASAGSGKTHTMIERLNRLIIEEKASVGEILAVTFTESAASDMKSKLKKAIGDKIEKGVGGQRLIEQLAEVSTADICTLHSFCARLIRSYFFVAGVSPDYKIVDENQSGIIKNESVNKTFRQFYIENESWFTDLIKLFGEKRTDKKLREMVLKAYEFCESEPDYEEFFNNSLGHYTYENFLSFMENRVKNTLSALQRERELLEENCQILKNNGYLLGAEYLESLINFIDGIKGCKDAYKIKELKEFLPSAKFERKCDELGKEIKKQTQEGVKNIKKILNECVKYCSSPPEDKLKIEKDGKNLADFIKILRRFIDVYGKEKAQENVMDFSDLERNAMLILNDEEAREEISKKYKYVFVDEYQDTNGVQENIISLIKRDNVFMVGDLKQSIYGFRGCKPEIFSNKLSTMEKNGQKTAKLNYNFRSAKSILDCVNEIFSFCMTSDSCGTDYASTSTLVSGGLYPDGEDGRAFLHFYRSDAKEDLDDQDVDKEKTEDGEEDGDDKFEKPRIYDLLSEINREEQPLERDVSELITSIINKELQSTYYSIKEKKHVQITNKDIVILTRNKDTTYVQKVVKGLRLHGIDVESDVKENVLEFSEVAQLVNILKALDCETQDVPFATLLKSDLANCSDEDLAEIAVYYKDNCKDKVDTFYSQYKFYLDNAKTMLRDKLYAFSEYLLNLRYLSDFIGAHGILNKIISDSNYQSYLLLKKNGKTRLNRLKRFLSASKEGQKILTLKEFLFKIENCPKAFEFFDVGNEDTIKVMTIHKSKGLEFPVVILCGLERPMSKKEESGSFLTNRKLGFAFKHFNDQKKRVEDNFVCEQFRERMREDRFSEEMRVFYVATTRATYSLHMIFEGKEDLRTDCVGQANKFIDFIPKSMPVIEHDLTEFSMASKAVESKTLIIADAEKEKVDSLREKLSRTYPFTADTVLPLKSGVTSAINVDENQLVHVLFENEFTGIERGITAHKILELYDVNSSLGVDGQVKSMIENGEIDEQKVKDVNLNRLKNVIESGALDCVKGVDIFREQQFIAKLPAKLVLDTESNENILVQGVIDLLCISQDQAFIIDYKYSSLDDESLIKKYKKQLDVYAYAVESVLEKKVTKKIIVNLFTGSTVLL